ncbi:MAG: hypothetical protein KC503_05585 [Myxococcales bacterium]|nr:hypothetical protein [Myxococcales bacterium]
MHPRCLVLATLCCSLCAACSNSRLGEQSATKSAASRHEPRLIWRRGLTRGGPFDVPPAKEREIDRQWRHGRCGDPPKTPYSPAWLALEKRFRWTHRLDRYGARYHHIARSSDGRALYATGVSELVGVITRLDDKGRVLWRHRFGEAKPKGPDPAATSWARGKHVAVSPDGKTVALAGSFWERADIAPGPAIAIAQAAGRADLFVAAMRSDGKFLWARAYSGTEENAQIRVAIGADGNVVVAATFAGAIRLCGRRTVRPTRRSDVFVTKLRARDGRCLWAKTWAPKEPATVDNVFVDKSGAVVAMVDVPPERVALRYLADGSVDARRHASPPRRAHAAPSERLPASEGGLEVKDALVLGAGVVVAGAFKCLVVGQHFPREDPRGLIGLLR